MKPFKEVIDGIRKAVMASEVREDLAQMGEYVEQFANTAGENIQKAIDPTLSLSGKAADAFVTGQYISRLAVAASAKIGLDVSFADGNITFSVKDGSREKHVWDEHYHYSTADIPDVTIPAITGTVVAYIQRISGVAIMGASYENGSNVIPVGAIIIYIGFTDTNRVITEVFNVDSLLNTLTVSSIDKTLELKGKPADAFVTGQYISRLAVAASAKIGLDVSFADGNITFSVKDGSREKHVWDEHYHYSTADIPDVTIPAITGTVVAYIQRISGVAIMGASYENGSNVIPVGAIIIYIGFTDTNRVITEVFNVDKLERRNNSATKTPGFYGKNIVLGGDSITHGVGGTGWKQNGRTIITSGSTTWKESPDSYSWANLMKTLLSTQYNCTVTNNGCTGTRVNFWASNIKTLVPARTTDIFILTIGTNDRNFSTIEECRKNILDNFPVIKNYCDIHNIRLCVFSPIPAGQANENAHVAKTWQINEWIREVCYENNIEYYDLHNYMYNWYFSKGENIGTYADGLHPNDEMYYYMFYAYCKLLDIAPGLPVLNKP